MIMVIFIQKNNLENQKSCFITYTSPEILEKGFENHLCLPEELRFRPRYCPSIEDKITRKQDIIIKT